MKVQLNVNGVPAVAYVEPGTSLLDVLRDELHLHGTKKGCVEGECGACTVLRDGRPIDSCLTAVHTVDGVDITTVEGVAAPGELSELQDAVLRAGGVQCGFCTPGIVMTLTALLDDDPEPDPDRVRTALAGNICRCTGYTQIVDAVVELITRSRSGPARSRTGSAAGESTP